MISQLGGDDDEEEEEAASDAASAAPPVAVSSTAAPVAPIQGLAASPTEEVAEQNIEPAVLTNDEEDQVADENNPHTVTLITNGQPDDVDEAQEALNTNNLGAAANQAVSSAPAPANQAPANQTPAAGSDDDDDDDEDEEDEDEENALEDDDEEDEDEDEEAREGSKYEYLTEELISTNFC